MANLHSLSSGARQARELASSSRVKRIRLTLWFAVTGALSFWLPDVAVHIGAGPHFDSRHVRVITILTPAIFLFAYVIARRVAANLDFKWVGPAMLLGVWLTGGLFMALAAMASGGELAGAHGVGRLVVGVLSVIPIVTCIVAAYDGSLFALLAVTLGSVLVCCGRASWMLLTSDTSSSNTTHENTAEHSKVE